MGSFGSVPVIGVSGDGEPQRGSDPTGPAATGGTQAADVRSAQRPAFLREAQRALRDLGYHPGPIDGTFGPQTRSALEKYQLAEKLPVTGQLDAETMARLDVYRRLFRPVRDR